MLTGLQEWYNHFSYEHTVERFLGFVRNKGYYGFARVAGTFLFEPAAILTLAYQLPLGWLSNFTWYGLNPSALKESQLPYNPVLLLHGNQSTQGAWLSLAKQLQQQYPGPVFTINLHNGHHNPGDKMLLEAKFDRIKGLYAERGIQNCTLHVIGHSRGASLAYYFSIDSEQWSISRGGSIGVNDAMRCEVLQFRPDVGRVIMMGSGQKPPCYDSYQFLQDKFRAIIGTKDRACSGDVALMGNYRVKLHCGHNEMLMAADSHELILTWLNEQKERPANNQLVSKESRQVLIPEGESADTGSGCVIC